MRFTVLMNAKGKKPPELWEWGEEKENMDLEKEWIDLPHEERREIEDERKKLFPEWVQQEILQRQTEEHQRKIEAISRAVLVRPIRKKRTRSVSN